MSALTFPQQREPALVRSFLLAAIVHLALAGVLFFGVRWQSHVPETVTVELWEAPPPQKVEAPKPPPSPPPPQKVEPEPPAPKKVDIVEKKKPEPKKVEPKKVEPPKKEAPRRDVEFEQRLREQVAQEQKALDAERRERELKELLARQAAQANQVLRDKALAEYISRIQAKVKSNWILPPDLAGNPEAIFSVVQLPNGEVISARVIRPSGNASYDAAVERAILKSSPLPLPASREMFSRELKLTFRPQDK